MSEPGRLVIPGQAEKPAEAPPAEKHQNPPLPKQVEILDVICHRSWNAAIEYQSKPMIGRDPKTGRMAAGEQLLQVSSLKAHPCVTKSCMMFDAEKRLCMDRVKADLEAQVLRLQLASMQRPAEAVVAEPVDAKAPAA